MSFLYRDFVKRNIRNYQKTNELLVELEYLNEKSRLDQMKFDISLKTKNAILNYAKKAV